MLLAYDQAMRHFHSILVYHPGAIGDVMLATPVLTTLKANFPNANLRYVGHPSMQELVGLTGCIDEFVPYRKELGLFRLRQGLLSTRTDLIIDLSGTLKSRLLTCFSGAEIVRYKKQAAHLVPRQHAVQNFLDTLKPLDLAIREKLFPTLSLPVDSMAKVQSALALDSGRELLALVPGVGNLRPHRAWSQDNWRNLSGNLSRRFEIVYVGGKEEAALARQIAASGGGRNLCGSLSLVETACVLKLSRLVISADTGPCHIAVAVGAPVLGLYGPTYPERSGPYGNRVIDRSHRCRCHNYKFCRMQNHPDAGACMGEISVEEVLQEVAALLA